MIVFIDTGVHPNNMCVQEKYKCIAHTHTQTKRERERESERKRERTAFTLKRFANTAALRPKADAYTPITTP